MKLRLLGVLLLGLVLQVSTAVAATEDAPRDHNPLRKLGRGFANIFFGVVEVPNQYTKAVSDHGGAAGVTYGLPKGFVRWICREFVGVYEVVTFAVPVPKGYKPVMKPEFPNEDYEP
jgi:putative exosortase-associated protein (TIGR04073 family)